MILEFIFKWERKFTKHGKLLTLMNPRDRHVKEFFVLLFQYFWRFENFPNKKLKKMCLLDDSAQ